jgi:hypothetical protein
MIAMPLTYPNFSEPPAPKSSTTARSLFQPLDPGVLNASIPAFFIGRNKDGFWLARDVKGQIGGIFLLESSAVAFARRHAFPLGCATIFPAERFELDAENQGNPLIGYLGPLLRLATRGLHRMCALTARIAAAVERRLGYFT